MATASESEDGRPVLLDVAAGPETLAAMLAEGTVSHSDFVNRLEAAGATPDDEEDED